jgi:hypothetical protein
MLTDTAIRKAKPTAQPTVKTQKLTDGGGIYLLLKPDGGRYWRMNYRHDGKQKTLALGVYVDDTSFRSPVSPGIPSSRRGRISRSEANDERRTATRWTRSYR